MLLHSFVKRFTYAAAAIVFLRTTAKARIPTPNNNTELGSGAETVPPLSAANPVAIAPLAALAGEEVTKMCAPASNPPCLALIQPTPFRKGR